MIYLLLILSLTANGILVWYIKTLIKKYLFDVEAIDKFKDMLGQYRDSLSSLYRLEELYGDETIKKAIAQTNFVIDACEEFKGGFTGATDDTEEAEEAETEEAPKSVIKLREGEKITQDADKYKRIIVEK